MGQFKGKARELVQKILCEDIETAQRLLVELINEAEQVRQQEAIAEANQQLGVTGGTGEDIQQLAKQQDEEVVVTEQGEQAQQFEEQQAVTTEQEPTQQGQLEDQLQVQGESEQQATEQLQDQGQVYEEQQVEEQPLTDQQVDQIVDDQININCQINAAVLEQLLNKIAELKSKFEAMGIQKKDRSYYQIKVPIQYYCQKLQKIQGKTNAGVDQEEVKQHLDQISIAIDELAHKINGQDSQVQQEQKIMTPDEVTQQAEQSDGVNEGEDIEETQEQEEVQVEL